MNLIVKKTKKLGRGIFAAKSFKTGEIVESAPVIVLDNWESDRITATVINNYVFAWRNISAIALGYGGLFNHSEDSNISYKCNYKKGTIDFKTLRNIKKGEQLFIDYGYEIDVSLEDTVNNRKEALKNERR